MSYIDGFMAAVPTAKKDEYVAYCKMAKGIFEELGALSVMETWGDDVPEGKTNSMNTAVLRKEDETVVFSWIVWPSKDVRDAGYAKMMEDPRMNDTPMPFDGQRMIYGGFVPIDL